MILDDYRSNWWTFGYLLRLTDKYPLQVAVKGGFVNFNASLVYITCPVAPDVLYADLESRHNGSVAQLTRRISSVRRFGDDPEPPAALAPLFTPA